MSVVHSGSNKQFAEGWETIFGGGKAAKSSAKAKKPAKKAAPAKAKKAAPKKKAKKK